jgi:hypothetical protein
LQLQIVAAIDATGTKRDEVVGPELSIVFPTIQMIQPSAAY